MTVIPGRRIVGRPGTATRVQGRCEGRASSTPSRLLPSVGAAGDRCLSCTRTPFGASAPMGRQRIRQPKRLRRRLPLSKGHPASKIISHCIVAVRLKRDNKGRSTRMSSDQAYGERYAAGRGLDPSFQTGVTAGAILVRICAGVTLYSRTSTCAGIPIFHLLRCLGSFVCRLGSLVRREVLFLAPFLSVD